MPTFRQGMEDKKIIETIRAFPSGEFGSTSFDAAVQSFIKVSLAVPEVRQIVERSSLSEQELCFFYREMVRHLMPNPYILAGGRMVAASLPFYEPFRLQATLSAIDLEIEGQQDVETRKQAISRLAEMGARVTWNSHTQAHGEATIPPSLSDPSLNRKGCAGVLVVLAAVLIVIVLATA